MQEQYPLFGVAKRLPLGEQEESRGAEGPGGGDTRVIA